MNEEFGQACARLIRAEERLRSLQAAISSMGLDDDYEGPFQDDTNLQIFAIALLDARLDIKRATERVLVTKPKGSER